MSKKPPKRSPGGTPPPGKLPPKHIVGITSPELNPLIHTQQPSVMVKKHRKPIETRRLVKKPLHNISSSMISWNEATTIDLTLKSLVGLVDEVILVDTGSFDGTPKIAREWMDELDLSGQVKQIRVKNIGKARLEAVQLCVTDWVMIQDSNLVLSESLKTEIISHMRDSPKHQLAVKSLNLFGDYEHYFSSLPFMAHHYLVVKADTRHSTNTERPYFNQPSIKAKSWAVNLSRVRPAWRYWYRGEPFDRKHYAPVGSTPEAKGHMHEFNRQYVWHKESSHYSMVEFTQETMGLSLEDVKMISPDWYLKYLQSDAVPLTNDMKRDIPDVIKQELSFPRYKLIYRDGKIIGRWPEL
ncbi:MAG: glycosyltransferase [bacterium]